MNAAWVLRWARRRAGLTQRQLARAAGVAQSTVARIESGAVNPHAGALDALLRACGVDLEPVPRLGVGVDRAHLRANLALTPAERLARVSPTAAAMAGWRGIAARRQLGEAEDEATGS